jgi:hypothetical protein
MTYVLRRSGCVGRLTSGRIEHDGFGGLNVYDEHTGEIIEYFSGKNLRSWCVFGPEGQRVEGWCEGSEEDLQRIFRFLSQH